MESPAGLSTESVGFRVLGLPAVQLAGDEVMLWAGQRAPQVPGAGAPVGAAHLTDAAVPQGREGTGTAAMAEGPGARCGAGGGRGTGPRWAGCDAAPGALPLSPPPYLPTYRQRFFTADGVTCGSTGTLVCRAAHHAIAGLPAPASPDCCNHVCVRADTASGA